MQTAGIPLRSIWIVEALDRGRTGRTMDDGALVVTATAHDAEDDVGVSMAVLASLVGARL